MHIFEKNFFYSRSKGTCNGFRLFSIDSIDIMKKALLSRLAHTKPTTLGQTKPDNCFPKSLANWIMWWFLSKKGKLSLLNVEISM